MTIALRAPVRVPEPRDSADRTAPCPRGCGAFTYYAAVPAYVGGYGQTEERCGNPRCGYRAVITGRPAPRDEPRRVQGDERACTWCGEVIPSRPGRVAVPMYCSDPCRKDAVADAAAAFAAGGPPCPCGCGRPVPVSGQPSKQRKYASPSCGRKDVGRRLSARHAERIGEPVPPTCAAEGCDNPCPRKESRRSQGIRFRATCSDVCLSRVRAANAAQIAAKVEARRQRAAGRQEAAA